ncbi:beta-ketoacyl synthase N-terminal-like domain-containing protein [Aureibacter tunicatorum]|uniref:PfaB family protein n=1 Tax=Aureibacter tunicatorum TaxID=866807 RepID=A0AAE3XMG3_9BACT|nr:beta-ketoacyl synthase N-terminal-like domain-containing protein [Aureibacter tunicatorum]MDR6239152.1 PfaB family protein [Aureibacter tunicatorum]BDD04922.1 hypothetical protein AUTU_24050 [Aureibacter tunicatorum]
MENKKEKIAVIGMGGLFPGSETLDGFWQNLLDNKDLVTKSDEGTFGTSPEGFYHTEKGKLDKCYALRGGYVRNFQFDAEDYLLPSNLLAKQDDQFKWSLHVAKEALKHSGYWKKDTLEKSGVILGNLSFPTRYSRQILSSVYAEMAEEMVSELTGDKLAINAHKTEYPADINDTLITNAPAALIAQAVGMKGMNYSLDAACASSLYAVKLACDELHTGRADMMLAGAVSGSDPLFIHMGFSYFHAYARMNEKSAPMDSASGGLTSAEGAGMVVLKRLSDAKRDGDNILAVIDAVGLSNDGKGKFLLSPNPKGQKLAFERAYEQTDLTPEQIDYLECHATGTPLGDNTEINSIEDFFANGDHKAPYMGSIKSNMGHLLTAAGMTGMLKVILAMQKQMIPATIKIDSPLKSEQGKISSDQMIRENSSWKSKGEKPHAGINAFGFGGTNAHMVLSAYEDERYIAPEKTEVEKQELAIVGMDMHFGNCESLEDFYLSLFNGEQHFRPLPERRWKGMEKLQTVRKQLGLKDGEEVQGAWLEEYDLDLLRFKIQPKEAERLTLQQTIMLKVADKAMKDANLTSWEGKASNVAVITAMESELEIHHRMGRWDLCWQVNEALEKAGFNIDQAKESALTDVLKDAIFPAYEDHSPSEHTGFIGNIISSRISALCDFTGPSFTVSSNENAVYKALEVARNLLAMKEVDAVVLGAVDLTGSMESVLSRHMLNPLNKGANSLSWNKGSDGWTIGEGAGAIVLKRAEDADEDRVYAKIDGIAITQSPVTDLRGQADAQSIHDTVKDLYSNKNIRPTDIGLLEVSGSGVASEDQAEIEGLSSLFKKAEPIFPGMPTYPTCALGSAKAHLGHTFAASGILSLIKTSLSLYHRFIPGVPQWQAPKQADKLEDSAFYVQGTSTPWLPEFMQDTLRAGVNGIASDGSFAHVLMSEADHPKENEKGAYLRKGGERLLPLFADSVDGLQNELARIESEIEDNDFRTIADKACEDFVNAIAKGEILVIVAKDSTELKKEIAFFKKGIQFAVKGNKPLQTPGGSYYTPKPLGKDGKLAWMYPGAGSAYPYLGSALFQAFPHLYDFLKGRVNHLSTAIFGAELYPRTLVTLDEDQKKQQARRLRSMALPMMAAGCSYSAMLTEVFQNKMNVKGDAAFGYSMGETSSMLYCQNIWDAHYIDEKFIHSPVFQEKVGGRLTLLAEHWGVKPKEARELWTSKLINIPKGIAGYATLEEWYRAEIEGKEERIFLSFINLDTEIVLSGDRRDLDRVLEAHGIQAMEIRNNNVVHHEFVRKITDELIVMHDLPIESKPDLKYYSGVTAQPLELDSKILAENAKEVCCQEVNLPKLVRQIHADGHTLFMEAGANATLCRWVNDILPKDEHVVIPTDRKGAGVLRNLCATTAMLLAHGMDADISAYYESQEEKDSRKKKQLKITLRTGGKPYQSAFTEENKKKFAFTEAEKPALVAQEVQEPVLEMAGAEPNSIAVSEPIKEIQNTDNFSNDMIDNKVESKVAENGLPLQDYNHPDYLKDKKVIWNEEDLLTFASGKISDVFGDDFAVIDTYSRRVMLPMPPYLLVSRVTELNAKTGEFKPSTITTEYDIPYNSWFATDGQIPWAVAVESGQCDLLLISYLGIDFENKGDYVYRLLDCTLTFLDDLPFEGQTLRYDIKINNYIRNGKNLLFFFSYECFVGDRMVLKMDNGCAGFFNDAELAEGQGIVYKQSEIEERNNRPRKYFTPLLNCDKTSFTKEELVALTKGDFVSCFNENYDPMGKNDSLRLPPEDILMLDRISKVDLTGGSSGIGFIEAEKDLMPKDWYFPCHFRDDEVLAGSLQAEGGGQLLRFFMLLLGMQRITKDARYQPVLDLPQKVRCRKEVPAKEGKLIYRMDVKDIGLTPEPYVVADLEIIYDGYVAVHFENLGLKLQEKGNETYIKKQKNMVNGIYVKPVDYPVLLNESQITEFALGPVSDCFGDEYKVYDGRTLSRQPNTDLQLISRVLSITGERHKFDNKPVITSEYDVPADAWYYKQNANAEMPYSVLMEIALQPCGFLGAYLGSTLSFPDKDLYFRNLDGDGEMIKRVDLRGKVITNKACLDSHTNLGGTVVQRYSYELFVDGEMFYKGKSSFGFFSKADLSSQAGLDQGQSKPSWIAENPQDSLSFNLDSLFGKMKLYKSVNAQSPNLHLAGDQLNLLDKATIVKDGGKYGKGYIHASRAILPKDWFFTCHFYQDPVMPGSLGVEAIHQAMQVFALQQGLADGMANVAFLQAGENHKTVWKYRGQILQDDPMMNLEVHIKSIENVNGKVNIVADCNLWKGELRIYEITDLALVIG